ncbi:MAG: riboflavin kinase [Burkholderiales bacterium]
MYGRRIEVRFLEKLRDEEKYASVEELVAQIGRDVEAARSYFRRRAMQPAQLGKVNSH